VKLEINIILVGDNDCITNKNTFNPTGNTNIKIHMGKSQLDHTDIHTCISNSGWSKEIIRHLKAEVKWSVIFSVTVTPKCKS
jgi:hypothetical protein